MKSWLEISQIFLIRHAREILSQISIWKNRQEGIPKNTKSYTGGDR
jgi:hypothetical protein